MAAPTLDELIEEAFGALERGDYQGALVSARDALALSPGDVDASHIAGAALLDLGDPETAVPLLERVAGADPDNADALSALGEALFETLRFERARKVLADALALDPELPDTHYWLGMTDERSGDLASAEKRFLRAAKLAPERFERPYRVSEAEFQTIVEEAIAELPEPFRRELRNLAVLVEPLPDRALLDGDPPLSPSLLGLHVGSPRAEHGTRSGDLPNTIHLFQRNLERASPDEDTLVEQVRITLWHEIGHYLGLDEDEVGERGLD